MRLHDFLADVDVSRLTGDPRWRSRLVHDSRRAGRDALFCCIPGAVTDGHDHAPDAVAAAPWRCWSSGSASRSM